MFYSFVHSNAQSFIKLSDLKLASLQSVSIKSPLRSLHQRQLQTSHLSFPLFRSFYTTKAVRDRSRSRIKPDPSRSRRVAKSSASNLYSKIIYRISLLKGLIFSSTMEVTKEKPSFRISKFPVLFPSHPAFTLPVHEYERFMKEELQQQDAPPRPNKAKISEEARSDQDSRMVESQSSVTVDVSRGFARGEVANQKSQNPTHLPGQAFVAGLMQHDEPKSRDTENMMLTENADVTYVSTTNALVDLFSELEEVTSPQVLQQLLERSWSEDPLSTLKIIFNARSIHLGKSSRIVFYRSVGWLACHHPLTLLHNLQWLCRPIIEKKTGKSEDTDVVLVETEKGEDDPARFDVKDGVAHGYWKDLLNILALAVNGRLNLFDDPRVILNIKRLHPTAVTWDSKKAKDERHDLRDKRHEQAIKIFNEQPFYRNLHITVARLFADQLKTDMKLLRDGRITARQQISLCAKWAPSQKLFHDKHTMIVSSIAELLHPHTEFADITGREMYLRHAREAYRRDTAALRKALEVVEREICAQTFQNINYGRVPSIAMNNYAGLFAEKDSDRFEKYIDNVAEGKQKISGAVLLPSTLVKTVRSQGKGHNIDHSKRGSLKTATKMVEQRMGAIEMKVVDGQWKTLVQRIRDSGTLENSIAVCDVSGSMSGPTFPDGTVPMDSAIGLSLLLAEVTKPPFGGAFITFSQNPSVQKIALDQTFTQKVMNMESADWGMNTDFVAVFEKLILPMARENKLTQEDMVQRVFVFSDMQFDMANTRAARWSTSYQRVQKQYELYGYRMPELIFWNLAGGRASHLSSGDPTAPKPVTADEPGTAVVSGYSQGLLKVFLDNGAFEEPGTEEEIDEMEEVGSDGEAVTIVEKRKKQKMDPLSTVKKAISHRAYDVLKVVD